MKQLLNYGNQRQTFFCAFCGGNTETKDHVPSKVFLDTQYPENLPCFLRVIMQLIYLFGWEYP